MDTSVLSGKIMAVCTSLNKGVPKYPQDQVVVGQYGLEGDYHNKPMRESFSNPGTEKPNDDRHITIVGWDAVREVNHKLGLDLKAGALGENILAQYVGDLSNVLPYSEVFIGNSTTGMKIMLRVVKQNQPCKNLVPYHPHYVKEIYDRRGLLCAIVHGVGETIWVGDNISIQPPCCSECGYKMSQKGSGWICFNCRHTLGYD